MGAHNKNCSSRSWSKTGRSSPLSVTVHKLGHTHTACRSKSSRCQMLITLSLAGVLSVAVADSVSLEQRRHNHDALAAGTVSQAINNSCTCKGASKIEPILLNSSAPTSCCDHVRHLLPLNGWERCYVKVVHQQLLTCNTRIVDSYDHYLLYPSF